MSVTRKCGKFFGVLILLATLFCGTVFAQTGIFLDVLPDAKYAQAVQTLAEKGIVRGDNNGNYNPDKNVTRAEAATIMCRIVGVGNEAEQIKKTSVSDVRGSHW